MLKNTRLFLHLAICTFMIASMVSCNKAGNTAEILANAEQMLEQQPDSVLKMLNSILYPENLSKRLFNRYNLLLLQAKDKSYKDIASDTVIFAVKDYYIRKKADRNAALAAFYCARVLHEQNADNTINAYLEAKELAAKTEDYNLKGLILSNLGIFYREHSLYEKAIASGKDAVVMADSCNIPELQANVRQDMGLAYKEKGYYEEAKGLFKEALTFSPDSVEQARILLNIAQVYILENKPDSVKFYLDKALALQIQDPSIMRTYYFLRSKMEEESKNYQEALKYRKEYYNYTLKVFDSEKNNKLLELQEKYNFEKIKNSNNQLTIRHQRIQILLLFALLAAELVIFTLSCHRNFKKKDEWPFTYLFN